jgi:uncharacterized protein YbaP (TraB family)
MPPRLLAVIALASAVLASAALGAGPAAAQPPVWVVHGPHATVVLFGSVHMLPQGLDWKPPALTEALGQASDVWFEVPLDDAGATDAARAALQQSVLPDGKNLDDFLPQAARRRLARVAKVEGLPPDFLQRLQPWRAELVLALAAYQKAGAMAGEGVERQLSAELPARVQRRAFETPLQQIQILAGATMPDQVASLEQTLAELEAGDLGYRRLIRAWMSGDVRRLRREALDPLMKQAPGVYAAMIVDRNRRWVKQIEARLKGPGEAVMVVGVGHLIGPDGAPALLREEGFDVEGP